MVNINDQYEKVIYDHRSWLVDQLYAQRELTGDLTFIFPAEPPGENGDFKSIKCHSSVIKSKSPYF